MPLIFSETPPEPRTASTVVVCILVFLRKNVHSPPRGCPWPCWQSTGLGTWPILSLGTERDVGEALSETSTVSSLNPTKGNAWWSTTRLRAAELTSSSCLQDWRWPRHALFPCCQGMWCLLYKCCLLLMAVRCVLMLRPGQARHCPTPQPYLGK